MKIFLSEYSLEPKVKGPARAGFLLKLEFEDHICGYADIFPWPEFDDPDISDVPAQLKSGQFSPLIKRSLCLAKNDYKARQKNQSLLKKSSLTNHHFIVGIDSNSLSAVEKALSNNYNRFKLKVGKDIVKELGFLENLSEILPEKSLRLDANGRLNKNELVKFLAFENYIEFFEDPTTEPVEWGLESPLYAYDHPGFNYELVKTQWQVHKPAKQSIEEIFAPLIVVSSYLDHPVGMAHAFSVAQSLGDQKSPFGLASHNLYQPNEFFQYIEQSGPDLSIMQDGPGIGMTSLLQSQAWKELSQW